MTKLMHWVAGAALGIVLLALGLTIRAPGAQSAWPRYQIVTAAESSIVRLDTRTGEMVAFGIIALSQRADAKFLIKQHGDLEFFEMARSAKEAQP